MVCCPEIVITIVVKLKAKKQNNYLIGKYYIQKKELILGLQHR